MREGIAAYLAESHLEFATNKKRVMVVREGVQQARDTGRLGVAVRSWYAFSREGNTTGLRRTWSRWRPTS